MSERRRRVKRVTKGTARAASERGTKPATKRTARPATKRTAKSVTKPTRSETDKGVNAAAARQRPRHKLKIGISCYAHFGGSGVVASELGRELARRGHEVHLIASHLPFRLRSFEPNIYFHEAVPAHYPVFEDAPSNLALATKMVEVSENYRLDVLHVHYAMPFATSAYLAKQILLPRQLGVITTLHGTDITVVGAEPSLFRVTQFSMQSSDRITAVSRYLKERAEATFGVTRPIEVIYNFVDPKVFAPKRDHRIRLGGPGTKVLMHASNFRPIKNIPIVIQVFAEVRKQLPAKLVMVGDGPEKAGAEALARELGVHRDVLFLGNQDCMEEMLPLADVFLLPSSSESFGLVALEAMCAEVPVVCSNAGGLPEVVEHGFTGFLHDPGHVAGYTASVLKLLTNDTLRRTMGRRGRRVALERFNAEEMVERYVKVYESLR